MALYVNGNKDIFWHWCKNCDNYPDKENIEQTTIEKPTENLCPECHDNENNKNCENGESDNGPLFTATSIPNR